MKKMKINTTVVYLKRFKITTYYLRKIKNTITNKKLLFIIN